MYSPLTHAPDAHGIIRPIHPLTGDALEAQLAVWERMPHSPLPPSRGVFSGLTTGDSRPGPRVRRQLPRVIRVYGADLY